MIENKYLITFVLIIGLGLFSFLVYKIIKSNENIKELEEEKKALEVALTSKDFTIKQLNKDKFKKNEKSDHETDYCYGKPIEVFDNKTTEHNKKNNKISDQCKKPSITTSEQIVTPQISGKLQIITDAISQVASVKTKSSPILTLNEDIEDNDTISTASILNEIIANANLNDIVHNQTCESDTMYVVKGDDKDDEDERESNVSVSIEEESVSIDEEEEEVEYEYVEEEVDEGEEGEEGEEGDEDVEYEYEEYEEEYEEEYDEEEDKKRLTQERKDKLIQMNISDIKNIAKKLNVKLSSGGKLLPKMDLIEKILLIE